MMTAVRMMRAGALMDAPATANLSASLTQSASAGLIVQSYCTQVAQQPDIVMPASVAAKMPPVNTFLKTARTNASDYLTNIQPKIILVVTDVAGYASEFTSFYNLINGKIALWKGGSDTAKADALALLQQLQNDVSKRQANVVGVAAALGGFQTKLNIDVSNFNTSKQQADIIIGGDQGAIASLNNEIDDLNKKIGGAAAGVALSGLTIIGGALMIAAGAIASFITVGTSTPLVVAGVAVVVVGAAGITASSIILANLIKAKGDLLTQRAQLDADLKFLTDFQGTIGNLQTSASNAATQVNNMKNAWDMLKGNLGNVIDSVQNARTFSDLPIVTQAYLDTAQGQWTDVLSNARTIQTQMAGVKTNVAKDAKGNLAPLNVSSLRAAA